MSTPARSTTPVLIRKITRRNPFAIEKLPLIARIFRWPFDRFSTPGRQALFGAPSLLAFFLYRRFVPVKQVGVFKFKTGGQEKRIEFDARNTQFSAVYFKTFAYGYEPQITALLDVLMPDDGVFLDVGSNWGWFSLFLASRPGFKGKVHAFEPFPANFTDLVGTVAQAGLSNRIECHNVALYDRSGAATMHLPDGFQSGAATLSEVSSGAAPGGKSIQTVTLDSLDLATAAVMKIDAEGSELKVLTGAANFIPAHRPMIVVESGRYPQEPPRTLGPLRLLRSWGYELFQVAWLRQWEGGSLLMGDDLDPNPQSEETLALARFDVEERFLRPDINVFACHRDRLPELETKFSRGEIPG
jgi:FkbM family methyltransferase